MLKKSFYSIFVLMFLVGAYTVSSVSVAYASDDERTLTLPAPDKKGGMPLMQAIEARRSIRSLSTDKLSDQELSNLLWATYGVSHESGKRTIPTARNQQKMKLYVGMNGFLWIYDAVTHAIHKISPADLSDISKGSVLLIMADESGDEKADLYGSLHAGSAYQNAGLYCASAGLGNVVHIGGADKIQEMLAPFLPSKYTVRILQSVGKVK